MSPNPTLGTSQLLLWPPQALRLTQAGKTIRSLRGRLWVRHFLQDRLARASGDRGFHSTKEETEAQGGFISRLSQAFPSDV